MSDISNKERYMKEKLCLTKLLHSHANSFIPQMHKISFSLHIFLAPQRIIWKFQSLYKILSCIQTLFDLCAALEAIDFTKYKEYGREIYKVASKNKLFLPPLVH